MNSRAPNSGTPVNKRRGTGIAAAASWLGRTLRALHRGEKAQMIILAAASSAMILGATALVVDIGFFARAKRDLQNDVDAMAMAGALDLPEQGLADAAAREWGIRNGVEPDQIVSIDFDTSCAGVEQANTVAVRLQREHPTFFARVLGITSGTLDACATAGRFSLGGGTGAVPWGLEDDCFQDVGFGDTYILKYDSDATGGDCDSQGGNFGALGVDLPGVGQGCQAGAEPEDEHKYRRAICFGASRDLCTVDAIDCVGDPADDCEGEPVSDYEICTETGNMAGPTGDGVDYRIQNTSEDCDTWEEVTYPEGGLRPRCNPWLPGNPATDSLRVILVLIVDGLWDEGGTHKVTLMDFAVFFLEELPQCTGTACDVTGRFIQTGLSGIDLAPLDPNDSVTAVTLLE